MKTGQSKLGQGVRSYIHLVEALAEGVEWLHSWSVIIPSILTDK